MCKSLFFGLVCLLIGISILANSFFGITIPVMNMVLASLFIYIGIKLLIPISSKNKCYMFFDHSKVHGDIDKDKYNVSFSSTVINLTTLNNLKEPKTINISTSFANAIIILPCNVPVRVKADTSFSSVSLPEQGIGSEYVALHGAPEPLLIVYVDCSFSSVVVQSGNCQN